MTQQGDHVIDDVGGDEVLVLFLAGKGRSGGTLLASLLGQLPGFFNIGELNRLWDWGLVSNFRCGCGLPVQECPTWHEILETADASLAGTGIPPIATARIDLAQHEVVRWPHMIRLLRARLATRNRWASLERYTDATSAVYRAIAHVTGARVVVDSSRLPIEPVALGLVPGVNVRVAQVIRDPRAVVYSWKRSKQTTDRDDVEYMPKFSAAFSTTSWLARNLVVEVIGRRRAVEVVQYDEMARDPAGVLRQLAAFVGEPAGDLEFLTSESATIAPTHSVGGNPVRMTSGAISITPDEEWRGDISPRDRAVGTAIALPLLHRYGLPVRSGDKTRPTLTTNAWLRFDTIRRDLRTAKPQTVLEVGAGEGGLGSWLASNFAYTGVEPDARSRAAASARLTPGRGRIVEQLEDVGEQQFDAVCAFEVLEHIGEDQKALEQWREYLRPSGWLLLSVPAHQDDYGPADELVGHYRRYEQSTLTDLLNHAGFDVVHFSSYGAGLGQVLQRARNTVAKRVAAKNATAADTPEERSSGSGRFMQPKQKAAAVAFAAIAAPGRLAQRPFASTNIGTGYVVLAVSIGVTPRRVLVIGTFDPDTPRSRQWLRLLDRLEYDVEVRNVGSWGADRAGAGSPLRMLLGALRGLWRGARHLATCERPDVVVFLYPGHLDACVLGPIARIRRIPAVLDVFISLYDTVVSDRGLRSPRSPVALATRALDVLACWSVPVVVVDTPEHADFFARFTHRGRAHFAVLWVGAEESRFTEEPDPGDDGCILWYLTYIPLHGFETVARAAALLADDGRIFRLIGDGQERADAEALAKRLALTNIEFAAPVPEHELAAEIGRSSMCLGVFGTSDKAARVVPNKVFQCAAAGRAIITAATPAIETAFGDALVTVPVGDASALADAVRALRGPNRQAAGARARAVFVERFSEAALAADLDGILSAVTR